MDEFLFTRIDKFKSSIIYQQYAEQISTFNERSQKRINQILTFLALAIPLFILAYFFYSNFQLRKKIQLNKDIIAAVNDISTKKGELQSISSTISSPFKDRKISIKD
jgi:hypothetical protein